MGIRSGTPLDPTDPAWRVLDRSVSVGCAPFLWIPGRPSVIRDLRDHKQLQRTRWTTWSQGLEEAPVPSSEDGGPHICLTEDGEPPHLRSLLSSGGSLPRGGPKSTFWSWFILPSKRGTFAACVLSAVCHLGLSASVHVTLRDAMGHSASCALDAMISHIRMWKPEHAAFLLWLKHLHSFPFAGQKGQLLMSGGLQKAPWTWPRQGL